MTLAARKPAALFGRSEPRIAPPIPVRSRQRDFHALSVTCGKEPYPWQDTAARYLTALGPDDRWQYPEVAIIVGRQNGKTTLLLPLVVGRLLEGQRIMHTAQNAKLPRDVHEEAARIMVEQFPEQLAPKRAISFALGHEEIKLRNGGRYRIVAPTRSGARGPSNDTVIIDELREMESTDFIAAAEPTLAASKNPQMVYLSNAGTATSEVLNALKKRGGEDPALAYLEWSADKDRADDDVEGWLEANPSIGHDPGKLDYLTRKLNSYRIADQLSIFETEHLCRWVNTIREPLVDLGRWAAGQGQLPEGDRPVMAISIDPNGKRASAAVAWPVKDEKLALRLLFDVTGNPIDPDRLGKDMLAKARELGVQLVGFDPLTDALLAKHFPKTEPITGAKFANATARFVEIVEGGRLAWADAGAVGEDLAWTARKPHDESGSFQAVRAQDDRPITAALATIRAVWLASQPGLRSVYEDRGVVVV